MKHKIIKFRGFEITKKELLADALFLLISAIISLLAVIVFNIHWSFYPGNTLFPPSRTVGINSDIYLIGTLMGAIIGFFIIKAFLVGVKLEEKGWSSKK